MKIRRLIPRLLLFLTLGLLTTIAIAWASSAFVKGNYDYADVYSSGDAPGDSRTVSDLRGRTYEELDWVRLEISSITVDGPPRSSSVRLKRPPVEAFAPPWWSHPPEWSAVLESMVIAHEARGWPILALRCEWYLRTPGANQMDAKGAVVLPFATPSNGRNIALPYRPIWRGLLADTLLFALAWSALLFAPRAFRTHLRRRRNLCPRCAYNLAGLPSGSPCPECGPARP